MDAGGQHVSASAVVARSALALVLLLTVAWECAAHPDGTQVYLSKAEALEHVFPGTTRVIELRHIFSRDEITRIESITRKSLAEGGFFLYVSLKDGVPVGYAAIVSEVGKVKPITHIVGMTPEAVVDRVAVMIYRESHGAEVAGERFMRQYTGKSLDDAIRLDKDVINIAGSTLSGHAICRGVRKALAAMQVVFLDRTDAERDALFATGTEMRQAAPVALPRGLVAPGHALAERRVMGTLCRIEAHSEADVPDDATLVAALDAALDEVARWDDVLSDWREDTPLARLNAGPAGESLNVSPELMTWLVEAQAWSRTTEGAFDPTVGALVSAWGLRTQQPGRPSPARLAEARAASGMHLLALQPGENTVTRNVPDVVLDPGASGKGWALDRAAEVLARHGVRRALLSFRSTLLASGPPPGKEVWVVPVVHDGSGRTLTEVGLVRGALSVSGAGASSFDDGPVSRGHVVDPKTGVPIPAGRLAWVRHASASAADALSTALLVRGLGLRRPAGASGAYVSEADAEPSPWPGSP
jgi:thiamine biosynthesis lipoprotein ApbE/Na+-translocating ferredoxin:NAD+ oxidoreductase RnfG subunit